MSSARFVRSTWKAQSALSAGARQQLALSDVQRFTNIEDARAFAQAIVDTVREPFSCSTRVARDRRKPLVLFGVRGRPEDTQGSTCTRWAMDSGISRSFGAPGRSCPEGRDGGLRGRHGSPASDTDDVAERPPGLHQRAQTRPFCSASRTSPSGASWSAKRTSCRARRTSCWRNCSTGLPTACRSSLALSC